MALMGKIRSMHFRDGKTISEIARLTSLSRNTIKKWLRAPQGAQPKYRRREMPSKLSPFAEALTQALKADWHRPKHERRTVRALHAELQALGYDGGYTRLTDFVRAWRDEQGRVSSTSAFVPLHFDLGDAFQFDWSEEGLVVGGIYRRLQVAHLKLCASRAFWLVAYPTQGHEMLFDAHTRGFAALGGVARRGIYECKGLPIRRLAAARGQGMKSLLRPLLRKVTIMIATVGIDLAKNVFAVHGVGRTGLAELRRPDVRRSKLLALVASWPPCMIGMETCSGAHHWAREFEKLGHRVRLMAPKFVAPYRKAGPRGKNDANDAEAICEAVSRPNMRFVPVKTIEQQAELFVHRARQGYVEERTALINRMRGLLSELGIVLPMKAAAMRRDAHLVLEDLPGWCNTVVGDLLNHLSKLDQSIGEYDGHLRQIAQHNDKARQLMRLAGIGPMTATALVATVGNGSDFQSSRQFCAWLGLTPGQHSSGGKCRLGGITKAGDAYLRTLLILGARSLLMKAGQHTDPVSRWALKVKQRRGFGRAVVAIAAKNARMCWAAMRLGDSFRVPA